MKPRTIFTSITIVMSVISLWAATGANVYLKAGIPATHRPWHGAEYASAARILASGKVTLPLLADAEGRRVFERLTSVENLSFYRDKGRPLCARLQDLAQAGPAASSISGLYFDSLFKGNSVHSEAARMIALQLRLTALSIELMHQLSAPVGKEEKCNTAINTGQQQRLMRIFGFAEITLSQRKIYPPTDLSIVLEAMAETLPVYKTEFSADYQTELRKKMEAHKADFSEQKDDTLRINRMLADLGTTPP